MLSPLKAFFYTHILRDHLVLEGPLQRVREEDDEVLVQLILPGALHVHHALHVAVLELGEEAVEDLEVLADALRVLRRRAEALLAQQHPHLEEQIQRNQELSKIGRKYNEADLFEGLGDGLGERPHGVGLPLLVHDGGSGGKALGPEPELPRQTVGHYVICKGEREKFAFRLPSCLDQ